MVSIYINGRRLEDLDVRAGQYFRWRFLAPGCWWQAHPFSLSAAPNGRWLRLTSRWSATTPPTCNGSRPGVRVFAEGPWGVFTAEQRRRPAALLIAAAAASRRSVRCSRSCRSARSCSTGRGAWTRSSSGTSWSGWPSNATPRCGTSSDRATTPDLARLLRQGHARDRTGSAAPRRLPVRPSGHRRRVHGCAAPPEGAETSDSHGPVRVLE